MKFFKMIVNKKIMPSRCPCRLCFLINKSRLNCISTSVLVRDPTMVSSTIIDKHHIHKEKEICTRKLNLKDTASHQKILLKSINQCKEMKICSTHNIQFSPGNFHFMLWGSLRLFSPLNHSCGMFLDSSL